MARRLARSTAAVFAAVLVLFLGAGGWFHGPRRPASPRTTAPPVWSWSATAWAGCAISFLYESKLAAEVRGVILDAPGVDLGAIVDHGARGRTLPLLGLPVPAPLTATAKAVAGWSHSVTSSGRGRGVTRGRGSMRAWRLDLVRFR